MIVVGAAVSFAVGGADWTVTVATEVAVPLTLVAVIVYSVVDAGVIGMDPEKATAPMPLLIVTVEAYAVDHESVAVLPGATVAGDAVIAAVGTGGGCAGSKPAPRQPEMSPVQIQAVTRIKRFMAKYTLHHPYIYVTVLASKKQNQRKEREHQSICQPAQSDSSDCPGSQFRWSTLQPRCLQHATKRSSSGIQNWAD
jgi:hypothetical protein